ncbi:hypothetical protein QE152_g15311 [Popillia japonica]|uniref:Uncharacterized protein n=1 Tax=Popillia japonica TaxID=7064 RepID=A0AAW1L8N1_POPJA
MAQKGEQKEWSTPAAQAPNEADKIVFPEETTDSPKQPTTNEAMKVVSRQLINSQHKQTDAHGNQPDIIFDP